VHSLNCWKALFFKTYFTLKCIHFFLFVQFIYQCEKTVLSTKVLKVEYKNCFSLNKQNVLRRCDFDSSNCLKSSLQLNLHFAKLLPRFKSYHWNPLCKINKQTISTSFVCKNSSNTNTFVCFWVRKEGSVLT